MAEKLDQAQSGFEECHLRSSNLSHYLGIIHAAEHIAGVTQILQAFRCPGRTESMQVDVVAGHGQLWVKVIARKAQALHLIWAGQGQYGERDLVLHAEDYVSCAAVYPINFVYPEVVFAFYNGVTTQMEDSLKKKRVTVLGEVVSVNSDVEHKVTPLNQNIENYCGNEKTKMKTPASSVTGAEDCFGIQEALSQVNARPNDTNTHAHEVDVCPSSDTTTPDTDSYSMHSNEIEHLASSVSLLFDDGQSPCKDSRLPFGDNTNMLRENDCVSSDYFDDVISLVPNKSLVQAASCQSVSTIHWEYDDIVKQYDEITNSKSSVSVSNIDSPVSRSPRRSNQEQLTSNNSAKSIKPNYAGNICMEGISFVPETRIVDKITESTLRENNLICAPLSEFISSELLSLNMVDYSRLDEILAVNNIQTIDNIGKINLDVSSLITLVSAIAHGRCNLRFQEQILSEQAAEERRDPVMPKLVKFMKGKKLYACETAVNSFQAILDLLGGDNERGRAKALLEEVTIIPDNPSFRTNCLPNTAKIKHRSKIIFGTGDSIQAVTMTANSGFVRAARHQGVSYAVYPHPSRALTELKEQMAEYINP